MEEELISEFQVFQIYLKNGSPLLDRLRDLAVQCELTAAELCEEWVAFSTQLGSRDLTDESCDEWAAKLTISNKAKGGVAKKKTVSKRQPERTVHTKNDYDKLFDDDDDLIGQYGADREYTCGVKRSSEEATPPSSSTHKARATENGATPTSPLSRRRPVSDSCTATTPGHSGFIASTPAGPYSHRKNSRAVVCSLNERDIPTNRHGWKQEVKVVHYDATKALTKPYHYMFQKISDKAIALLERTEQLGTAVCHHHSLPEPLSVAQPSLEPATYIGHIVCDGEGHLNASSCLLEGPVRSRTLYSHRVRLEMPDSAHCSLFPGQVVAVEGINTYGGSLVSSVIYDQGVYPPLPQRTQETIGGFTLMATAGPFSTCDSLDMAPLHDVIARVREEEPHVLLLMGPYVDVNNSIVKTGCLPEGLTLQEFFSEKVLQPLLGCVTSLRTQLLVMPSQRDAHHPFEVYPQPPFQESYMKPLKRDKSQVLFLPDPCTLSINGVCVGATSTDILFHLSARTMFGGSSGDRMARLAGHVLRQQCVSKVDKKGKRMFSQANINKCYYPLVPPYRKEEACPQVKPESNSSEDANDVPRPPNEACEVNLDYVQAFEEQHASLPARPDILLLPSDLRPFVKVLDGCVCINPGHLTRKITGGTFVKLVVPELPAKPDLSTDINVSVVHI